MNRTLRLLTLALATALAGCDQKDKTPPPPPVVDPIATPTPLTVVSVTGSAEYGSKIHITGGAADADTTADQFTARWRVDVKLKPDADNTLTVTATDAAGNTSDPTTVKVTQASSKPATVKLSFSSPAARAGELVGLVVRVVDQYGNEMSDPQVSFDVSPSLAASFTIPGTSPAVTKDQGVLANTHQFVAYDLSGVKSSGYQFTIKATAGGVSDSEVLTVNPAPALSFSKLAWSPSGTQLSVQAGQDASYGYEVVDLYGNVTTGPVSVFTSAPGAIVLDDGVSGSGKLTRLLVVGSYTVAFYIAGVGQKGSLNLDVGVAPGAFVDVSASSTLASPQSTVKVFARVRDAYGNPIDCAASGAGANTSSITFSAAGALGGTASPLAAVSCFNGAFEADFKFGAEDTWAVTVTWQPTGATAVSSQVFITVLAFDNTPPTIAIQNVAVNGTPCNPATGHAGGPGCDVSNGDTVTFDAVATDNVALAQVSYVIFFQSTQSTRTRTVLIPAGQASATVSFRFTVNSNSPEVAPLVAEAVDRAGNIQTSSAVNFYVQFGVPLGGRAFSTVVSGPPLNNPTDVVADSTGALWIANNGGNTILTLAAGSTVPQQLVTGVQADYLALGSVGGTPRLFASDGNAQRVYVFDAATGANQATLANNWPNAPTGLSLLSAMPSKGWANVTAGVDGDAVVVGTVAYQLDAPGGVTCTATATVICVSVATGATGDQKATALASAINSNSTVATAVPSGSQVQLAAKTPGESSANPIALAKSPLASGIVVSAASLVEGHDADLWVGNDGDTFVRRFLTSGGPYDAQAGNHGQFNVTIRQSGIAVRDVWASPSANLQDVMIYLGGLGGSNRVAGDEVLTTSSGTTVTTTTTQRFSLTATTVGTPTVFFNQISDVVLAANGCLLAADSGNGNIYAIDTRTPGNFNPSVERIARNLPQPTGLAIDPSTGDLLIADNANAIFRLSPLGGSNCF